MSQKVPLGEEKQVKMLGGASIDGAPVAYIIVLAAVVTSLAFIPFSFVMGIGGTFPLSQGVYSLVGFVLGPFAGALADGIGCLLGIFLAPHTAGVPVTSLIGAVIAGLAAGAMAETGKRKFWHIWISFLGILAAIIYASRAIYLVHVKPWIAFTADASSYIGTFLYLFPTRRLFAKWISNKSLGRVALGLFVGTWASWGIAYVTQSAIEYVMFSYPEEVFLTYMPLQPIEYLVRCLVSVVIGTGVIAGLRAIGIVKPAHAVY